MTDYNFTTLNDKEFEDITLELISRERNKKYQRFKQGRDGGIDGIYFEDCNKEEIVQCKHFLNSGYSQLKSKLKKEEVDKVKKLNPKKYIFITSLSLTKANVDEIFNIFAPFIKSKKDIYYQEKLNDILKDNKDIEERYYKLWLSSTTILKRILNNAIENRSEFILEEIEEKAKYYVVTDNHNNAIKKLEDSHIIIIAGEAGIGKTTLAESLCLYYTKQGFKFYDIENSIKEADDRYDRDENQIFYFDDFLGATYLNAIQNKSDSYIVKFINRIKRDKKKRFILTSRTNIFNQGILLSSKFKDENIESEEFIIKINSLNEFDKAKILYNHLYFSDLDYEFKNEFYIDKRYKEVIKHKNFNPRLINFITDSKKIRSKNVEIKKFWNYIKEKLNNPHDVWEDSFDEGIDEFGRILVLLTVLNGNRIEEETLRTSYNKYIKLIGLTPSSHQSVDFDSVVKKVVRYFLNRNENALNKFYYTLFNPSVADFILNRYSKEIEKLKLYYHSLENDKALRELINLRNNNLISKKAYIVILNYLLNKSTSEKNTDYLIYLYSCANEVDLEINKKLLKNSLQALINGHTSIKYFEEFSELLYLFEINDFDFSDFDFISNFIFYANKDLDEINKLIKLYNYVSVDDSIITDELNELVTEYIKEELESEGNSIYEYDVQFEESFNEDGYFEVIEGEVENIIEDKLSKLNSYIEYYDGYYIDEEDIKESIYIEDIKERLSSDYTSEKIGDYVRDKEEPFENSIDSNKDNIDNLFERQ